MSTAVPFAQRPLGDTLILFDVDETLSKARQPATVEMLETLKKLRQKAVIGFVGGSNLVKQVEQLSVHGGNNFDYCFAENGLIAYKAGKQLASQSFIQHLGEEDYKEMVKFILHYVADLDIPIKRGTFIEFRNGMINVSPIGRNATIQERHDFNAYDQIHNIRKTFIAALQQRFSHLSLTYSIGGEISFDVFPTGWNKTYCLRHVQDEHFKEIHFFGDKTMKGGNDYEIYIDERTIGHSVKDPEDTLKQLREIFLKD